jgi:hypothetical protein
LIVDDVFDFYDLDTAALDIMPKYVTDENISLYDRVTSDIDKADLKYVLDNEIIRGLNDRLTDENIEKAKYCLQIMMRLKHSKLASWTASSMFWTTTIKTMTV